MIQFFSGPVFIGVIIVLQVIAGFAYVVSGDIWRAVLTIGYGLLNYVAFFRIG